MLPLLFQTVVSGQSSCPGLCFCLCSLPMSFSSLSCCLAGRWTDLLHQCDPAARLLLALQHSTPYIILSTRTKDVHLAPTGRVRGEQGQGPGQSRAGIPDLPMPAACTRTQRPAHGPLVSPVRTARRCSGGTGGEGRAEVEGYEYLESRDGCCAARYPASQIVSRGTSSPVHPGWDEVTAGGVFILGVCCKGRVYNNKRTNKQHQHQHQQLRVHPLCLSLCPSARLPEPSACHCQMLQGKSKQWASQSDQDDACQPSCRPLVRSTSI